MKSLSIVVVLSLMMVMGIVFPTLAKIAVGQVVTGTCRLGAGVSARAFLSTGQVYTGLKFVTKQNLEIAVPGLSYKASERALRSIKVEDQNTEILNKARETQELRNKAIEAARKARKIQKIYKKVKVFAKGFVGVDPDIDIGGHSTVPRSPFVHLSHAEYETHPYVRVQLTGVDVGFWRWKKSEFSHEWDF